MRILEGLDESFMAVLLRDDDSGFSWLRHHFIIYYLLKVKEGMRAPIWENNGNGGHVVGMQQEYQEYHLNYQDGSSRCICVWDEEIPYPDGKLIVSSTDLRGVITHCNASFVEMSGYAEDELMGQPHHILRHPDMPAAAFKDLWDTVTKGMKWRGYVKNLRKDGRYYWVYATVIPSVRHGEVVGYTSVRRKPSRTQVNACISLYARMKSEEV